MTESRSASGWPPVVVASVFQTGLNLMRDLLKHGVQTVGVDCHPEHEGFRSRYGKSYLCPNPDTDPEEWVKFMVELAATFGGKPVLIPAADEFVSAISRHAEVLQQHYLFSMQAVAVQGALASKEHQYALAREHGLPIPQTAYVQTRKQLWVVWDEQERFPNLALQHVVAAVFTLICLLQIPWTVAALRFERTHATYPAKAAADYLKSLPGNTRIDGFDHSVSVLPYFERYPFHLQTDVLDVPAAIADDPDAILLRDSTPTPEQLAQLSGAGYRLTQSFCGTPFFPNQPWFRRVSTCWKSADA